MYSVFLANELIREAVPVDSRSTLILSPMEFRIKYLLISLIQKDDYEFDAIDISVPVFAKYFGLKWGGEQTKSLKIAIENLIEFSYVLDGNIIRWLAPESHISDSNIHLKLDNSLIPYLLRLDTHFTSYNYESVAKFTSKYSYRIYEFLKSSEGLGFYKISLDDAISMLGDGCCKTKASFIKRVLTPALNDINNHSDIRVKRRFHQPFGKGEQIWFSIRNINDDTPQENIKYHSKSTADLKKKHIKDDNLMPIAVAMDDRMKKLIAEAEFSRPEKTKPRRFKGGIQSDK